MAKLTLNDVGSLIDATTAATTINNNSTAIETAVENTLSRDGTTPNEMNANIDMNSHNIINLPAPATESSPLRLVDLQDFNDTGTISLLPPGGTTGQALSKIDNSDYAVTWGNKVTSVGLSLPSDFNVSGSPVTGTGTLTGAWATTPTGTGAVVRATSPTLVTPVLGTPSSATLTNASGLPISTGVSGLGAGVATFLGTPTSANLGSAVSDKTGTGSLVFGTGPTITLANGTGLPISTGVSGLGTNVGTFLATPSSANLAAALTDETGSGANVFATSPTITTPNIVGTSTNNNASAGSLGEYMESEVLVGSAVSLTSNVTTNITSFSLTAGDWDCGCALVLTPSSTITDAFIAPSDVSATLPTAPNKGAYFALRVPFTSAGAQIVSSGERRYSLASTTTIYLTTRVVFAGTCTAYGLIFARRIR